MKGLKYWENCQNVTQRLVSKCYWKHDADRLVFWHRVTINLQSVKSTISAKYSEVKCNKRRYACTDKKMSMERLDSLSEVLWLEVAKFEPSCLDSQRFPNGMALMRLLCVILPSFYPASPHLILKSWGSTYFLPFTWCFFSDGPYTFTFTSCPRKPCFSFNSSAQISPLKWYSTFPTRSFSFPILEFIFHFWRFPYYVV